MSGFDVNNFARLLKNYRLSAGLTQEELAEKAGLSGRAISDLERGVNRVPRRDTLELLMTALQLTSVDRVKIEAATKSLLALTEGSALGTAATPPHVTSPSPAHNLPFVSTPLIGRTQSLTTLQANLSQPDFRLLTLTGPGGIGKTRLALQLARNSLTEFKDGVFFVDLSTLKNPALALSSLAQVLKVRQTNSRTLPEALVEYLRDKQILLVLDNLEQLLDLAPDISRLLEASGGLKIVATSRERLRLRQEKEYVLPPLELPDPRNLPSLEIFLEYNAVALFSERASNVNSAFTITSSNAPAIAEICYQLDGLPLAIELAAAYTKIMSPQAILTRFNNRLKWLTQGFRDLPERHQTLNTTIAWSYDLLGKTERQLFEQISVFAGSFRLEALEAVCQPDPHSEEDLLNTLMALVDKSLVQRQEQTNAEPGFRMLATIRNFALERLGVSGEQHQVQERHCAYYLTLAEQAELKFRGPEESVMLSYLDYEHDNLREALSWALENNLELAGRIGGALWFYWEPRGYLSEGKRWLDAILNQSEKEQAEKGSTALSEPLRARVLRGIGWLSLQTGDYSQARQYLAESLDLFRKLGNKRDIARILNNLSHVLLMQGNYRDAELLLDENIALMDTFEDKVGLGRLLQMRAWASSDQGNHLKTKKFLQESMKLLTEAGDRLGVGYSIHNLGWSTMVYGDYEEAERLFKQSLEIFQTFGDKLANCVALTNLGWNNLEKGEYTLAESFFGESLAIIRQVQSRHRVLAETLEGVAYLEGINHKPEKAARLLGAAEQIRENLAAPNPPAIVPRYERTVASVQRQLDPLAFDREWAGGKSMSFQTITAELGHNHLPGNQKDA